MRIWNRLSYRLAVLIVLLAVIPLAIIGLTTVNYIRTTLLGMVADTNGRTVASSVGKIKSSLTVTVEELGILIRSHDLAALERGDQEWLLQQLLKDLSEVHSLTVLAADGRELLKVAKDAVYNQDDLVVQADMPDFGSADRHRAVLGEVVRAADNRLFLNVYFPLFDFTTGRVTGVLEAYLGLEKLLGAVAEIRVGETGLVYIVDPTGRIIVHPDRSVVLAGTIEIHNPLVERFVNREKLSRGMVEFRDSQGRAVLTSGRSLQEPQLLVVIEQETKEAMAAVRLIGMRLRITVILVVVLALFVALYFSVKTSRPLRLLEQGVQKIGHGHLDHRIPVASNDEIGTVTRSFNEMAEQLENSRNKDAQRQWIDSGLAELGKMLRGEQAIERICAQAITYIASYVGSQVGTLYLREDKDSFVFQNGYAISREDLHHYRFHMGQGLPGQVARDRQVLRLDTVPADYLVVTSSLGSKNVAQLCIMPLIFNEQVEAVMELGFWEKPGTVAERFLEQAGELVAVMVAAARSHRELEEALAKSEKQAAILEKHQQELHASNEELEEQTQMLQASEKKLKEQQEELQASNEELEEKTEFLTRSKRDIEEKNRTLEDMRRDLEQKAEDLAIASKYKSEFLANMSHELRTPLNSLLLLAGMLAENQDGNLTEDQIDSARVIFNSGNDLLQLINEILDLAKIESGKMSLQLSEVSLNELTEELHREFRHLAEHKDLVFEIDLAEELQAAHIITDHQRLLQVLRNFLANSFKFTDQGRVGVRIFHPQKEGFVSQTGLAPEAFLGIAVSDTGIGIPTDKQRIIFEAFQQLEGGADRKFGGTGLGLSIARELATLLGGEIHLESRPGEGSTFSLYLPQNGPPKESSTNAVTVSSPPFPRNSSPHKIPLQQAEVEDDRNRLQDGRRSLLIIEDDSAFAKTLLTYCRKKGFLAVVATSGEEGLELAQTHPYDGIILDIHLPGIDGWTVLSSLKENQSTRHIPVHFMSADDEDGRAFTRGAIGYLTKPVSSAELEEAIERIEAVVEKRVKDVLLVEDNIDQQTAIRKLISDDEVTVDGVVSGEEAIAALAQKKYDCMILDLGLPDISGFKVLEKLEANRDISLPPVVVYTGRDLSQEEEMQLRAYSDSIIIKGVRSHERLLDETSLFLHRMVDRLPAEKKKMISALHDSERVFAGKTVLLVDDDMRNVFALAKVLQTKGMQVLKAENGIRALEMLAENAEIDLVLMDIMMPKMDGYETMRRIRANDRWSKLPIIALTAKAMQKDKDECMAAGANDYLPKPVDVNRLLSMMRVWLFR